MDSGDEMSGDTQKALADYKAEVDAKYARMKGLTIEDATAGSRAEAEKRRRKDGWLLINPQGRIDGVIVRWSCESAVEAFEQFYPKKRERLAAAAAGWHIEQDDERGSRFEAYCAEMTAAGA